MSPDARATEPIADVEITRAAYEELLPLYLAVPKDQIVVPKADVEACVVFALNRHQLCLEKGLRERMATLSPSEFDVAHLDRLPKAARGVAYARQRLAASAATTLDLKLPGALAQRARDQRAAAMRLLEYHFDGDPELAPILEHLRKRSGYYELGQDLEQLARLEQEHRAVLAKDPYFKADEAAALLRTSKEILERLAAAAVPRQREMRDLANRSWTVLVRTYREVAAAGRFLLRDEGGDEVFPSLFVVGRRRRERRPAASEPEGVDPRAA